jgi:4-hydroxy-tetrahydrodipicolinate reductase
VQVARAGDEKGTHTVRLIGKEEELTLEHRVLDRGVFAKGALQAAAFLLSSRSPGLYSMDDVFADSGKTI